MSKTISSLFSAPVQSATNSVSQSESVVRSAASAAQAVVEQASVSLDSDLGTVTAATSAGQITLTLAQILQSATSVDPSTGHREITDGANAQLTSALSAFLVANGFSEQQAAQGVGGLFGNPSETGEMNLSMMFQDTTSASSSSAEVYAGQSGLTSATVVTERSGSISVGINLDTGQLSVSLTEASASSYGLSAEASSTTAGAATASLDGAANVTGEPSLSGKDDGPNVGAASPSPLSESLAYSYVMSQQSTASTSSADGQGSATATSTASGNTSAEYNADINGEPNMAELAAPDASQDTNFDLFDWLSANSAPRPFVVDDGVPGAMTRMANSVRQRGENSPESGVQPTETVPAPVNVGFSQVLSVQQRNLTGHGTTIYKRPDGSVGAITAQPIRVTA